VNINNPGKGAVFFWGGGTFDLTKKITMLLYESRSELTITEYIYKTDMEDANGLNG
jgi:hypothetical protein